MEAVEQKILLEQIFAAYRKTYDEKHRHPKFVDRGLKVLVMRIVEGKTLTEIGSEFGLQKQSIRFIEQRTYRRLARVIKRLKLNGMY